MNDLMEQEKIELLDKLNNKLTETNAQLKQLNETNTAILEKLNNMQNGEVNSIFEICKSLFLIMGTSDTASLSDIKELIERKK